MKPARPKPISRGALALWAVACCALIAVVGVWVLVTFFDSPSASEVRAEGERVAAVLEDYRARHRRYPPRLEDTAVAEMKFRRGLGVSYMPHATLQRYVLTVTAGGHTWTYDSATGTWELAASG
jgi:hypothetical protein